MPSMKVGLELSVRALVWFDPLCRCRGQIYENEVKAICDKYKSVNVPRHAFHAPQSAQASAAPPCPSRVFAFRDAWGFQAQKPLSPWECGQYTDNTWVSCGSDEVRHWCQEQQHFVTSRRVWVGTSAHQCSSRISVADCHVITRSSKTSDDLSVRVHPLNS